MRGVGAGRKICRKISITLHFTVSVSKKTKTGSRYQNLQSNASTLGAEASSMTHRHGQVWQNHLVVFKVSQQIWIFILYVWAVKDSDFLFLSFFLPPLGNESLENTKAVMVEKLNSNAKIVIICEIFSESRFSQMRRVTAFLCRKLNTSDILYFGLQKNE